MLKTPAKQVGALAYAKGTEISNAPYQSRRFLLDFFTTIEYEEMDSNGK